MPSQHIHNLVAGQVVDASLFGEGILSTVCHATRELLTADAIILPQAATLYAAAIESETARQGYTHHKPPAPHRHWSREQMSSVDLSEWNRLMSDPLPASDSCLPGSSVPHNHDVSKRATVVLTHQPFDTHLQPQKPVFLTEKAEVGVVNLTRCVQHPTELEWQVELPVRIEPQGRVDAVLVWFELTLIETRSEEGGDVRERFQLNTGPEQTGVLGHWGQAAYFIPPPQPYLKAGDTLSFTLQVVPKGQRDNSSGGGEHELGSVLELLWTNPAAPE